MATRATDFGLLALDRHDPMRRQSGPSLGDELLDAVDRLHALRNLVVVNYDELRLALQTAPLVSWERALRRAPNRSR
jgi:hypothetical protein